MLKGVRKIEEEDEDVSTIDEAINKIKKIKKLENDKIKYDLEFQRFKLSLVIKLSSKLINKFI